MRKIILPATLAVLTASGIARADAPSVVADIAPLHSLVAQVMGSVGDPALIVSQGASPHGYAMRPSQARALQNADAVFWVSEGLTPWLADTIETLAPDALNVELLGQPDVFRLPVREDALFEAHVHDHGAEGDHAEHDEHDEKGHDEHHGAHDDEEHAEHKHAADYDNEQAEDDHHEHGDQSHDAHAWLDPANASVWLGVIAETLAAIDPENAETYLANADAGVAELEALRADINSTLEPVRERSFIVFHDAFQYFENAFDFPASGAISLSDATTPGPARVQQIHDRVANEEVSCVLAEPQFNQNLVATVLDGTDAQSGVIDPVGSHLESGPSLYPQLLRDIAQTLAKCLSAA